MRSYASIRRPRSSRAFLQINAARRCGRCSDARAKRGARSRAPTGWWCCVIEVDMRRNLIAVLALAASSALACAQDWPNPPVTMIVPYAAGGPVDTVGRIMAQGLTEALGH